MKNFIKRFIKRQYQKYSLRQRYVSYGRYKELPKNMTESQTKLIDIFKEFLYNKLSKLNYDVKSKEACISYKQDDAIYYMFIKDDTVRIINTVHAYDTDINQQIYEYMMWLFYNKQHSDFTKFRKESNQKINHSMDAILEKVRANKELNDKE